jgi:signal transduction histidine kinase
MHPPPAGNATAGSGRLQQLHEAMHRISGNSSHESLRTIIELSMQLVEGTGSAVLARTDTCWKMLDSATRGDVTAFNSWLSHLVTEAIQHLQLPATANALRTTLTAADGAYLPILLIRLDPPRPVAQSRAAVFLLVQRGAGAMFSDAETQLLEMFAWHASLAMATRAQPCPTNGALKAETAEVTQQLATQRLEEARQELDSFSYSVSHDLRAPVRHINSYVAMLRKHSAGTLDETATRHLDIIAAASQRLGTMVDDLLSLSRINRAPLAHVQIDTDELVREIVAEMRPQCKERSVEWQIDALPTLWGDRTLVRAALVCLLGNALKFTRPRQVAHIVVGTVQREPSQTNLYVSDNGVGFDPNYSHNLFGVFRRLHHVSEFEGTGIGLACVKRIAERHGGHVGAEGQIGQGAKFYFSLPRAV